MALPNNPQTRKEMYLSNMAGQGTALPSEPHTREEEYLDFIAKNGGGGGGTGDGDMKKSVYDNDNAVLTAGGIKPFVNTAISGKVDKVQGKGLSSNDYDDSAKAIVDGVTTELDGKVSKSNTAGLVKNDGTIDTTITGAVAANTSAISTIKDGANIDSFGDVETALAGKMPNYGIGTGLYVDSDTNQLRADAVTLAIKDSPKLITSGAVFSGLSPKYSTAEQEETDLDVQDKFPFYDYSASAKRHTTFGNIKAKLKEYFDSLYVAAVTGKGLSTNDYDDTAKGIVDNIQSNVIANTKLIKDTVGWSGKNKWDKSKTTGIDATITQTSDGFRTQVSNHTWGSARCDFPTPAKNKDFILTCKANVATAGNFMKMQVYGSTDGSDYSNSIAVTDTYSATKKLELAFNSGNYNYLRITLYLTNGTATSADVTFEEPMLCDADILDSTYEPYFGSTAFPRSEQAVLGAKQFYNIDAPALQLSNVTATKSNNGWQVQTSASATYPFASFPVNIPANTDIRFSCGVAITSGSSVISIDGSNDGSSYTPVKQIFSPAANVNEVFNSGNYKYYRMRLFANFNETASTDGDILYSDILFTLASDTDRTVVPYAMTNRELTESKFGMYPVLTNSDDLNDIKTSGIYGVTTSPAHSPVSGLQYYILFVKKIDGNQLIQIVHRHDTIYSRRYYYENGALTWSSWYKFEGTVVS